MQIQWQNNTTVTIKGRDYRVIINPLEAEGAKFIIPQKENDLLISTKPIKISDVKGFHINGSGEYSYQGVTVQANAIRQIEDEDKINLISLSVENILVAIVFGITKELTGEDLEFIGSPDILILSLSESFSSEKALNLINAIEPRIVIPVYTQDAQLQGLVSEYGIKQEPQDDFSIKKSELPFDIVEIKPLIQQIKS
jgi:hypothetical protein